MDLRRSNDGSAAVSANSGSDDSEWGPWGGGGGLAKVTTVKFSVVRSELQTELVYKLHTFQRKRERVTSYIQNATSVPKPR